MISREIFEALKGTYLVTLKDVTNPYVEKMINEIHACPRRNWQKRSHDKVTEDVLRGKMCEYGVSELTGMKLLDKEFDYKDRKSYAEDVEGGIEVKSFRSPYEFILFDKKHFTLVSNIKEGFVKLIVGCLLKKVDYDAYRVYPHILINPETYENHVDMVPKSEYNNYSYNIQKALQSKQCFVIKRPEYYV